MNTCLPGPTDKLYQVGLWFELELRCGIFQCMMITLALTYSVGNFYTCQFATHLSITGVVCTLVLDLKLWPFHLLHTA